MPAARPHILVLTQDPVLAATAAAALESRRHQVIEIREPAQLAPLLLRDAVLVVVDARLPDRALETAAEALAERRDLPVLVLGAAAAWDRRSRGNPLEVCLPTPVEPPALAAAAAELLDKSRFLHESLVGSSEAMAEVRERILLIAPTPVTVLLSGESGTGKDVVAQVLHHYSPRRERPFKPINCAAIPENLLENELFGHEKGSFTDARTQTQGIFEQADGGTVFLDEIGEMARSAQVRLLRVLEERRVTRIGGDTALPVDVRVIAASNRDLLQAVSRGEFRRDLYHRLKVVELALPPLRARREDIPGLIEHFTRQHAGEHSRLRGFSRAAMDLLLDYDWPGNVRELRNLVEYLVFMGPERLVEPADVLGHLESPPVAGRHLPMVTHKTPDQSERELIYFALLDLKREISDLRQLLERGGAGRPVPGEAHPVLRSEPVDYSVAETAEEPVAGVEGGTPMLPLKDLERQAIERALSQVGGNRRQAASLLGIGVRTLYRKLDEYGLK
ncbi:MAG: sigma-54 dependent transcriptional regulator [Gemmatimonadota bacterium]